MQKLSVVIAAVLLASCSTPPPPVPVQPEKPAPAIARFNWFVPSRETKAPPDEIDNPILPGFYPDPSVVRVGDDFYLVNSTFAYFPGLPIFHSRDLMHWQQISNAVDRPSQANFDKLEISRGLFAPAIDYHDGVFAIVNTCVDCGGNFLITATNPAGPWSDPVRLDFDGIDPSLFFDANGKTYIVNNGPPDGAPLYQGHRAIWMQEFDWQARKQVGPRRVLVNGGTDIRKKPIWIEGPHLFRNNGWYYLMCAEGGTAEQHSEVIFRSKKVWGPYISYKANPILTQRDLDPARPDPVTSTGHAQLMFAGAAAARPPAARARHHGRHGLRKAVRRAQGSGWWAVFLGTQPYADDFYNTGRETFLLPVTWKKGWPVILPKGKPVPLVLKPATAHPGVAADRNVIDYPREFAGEPLAPDWLFIRTPHEKWYSVSDNALNITPRPVSIGGTGQPSFVGLRQQYAFETFRTLIDFVPMADGQQAGLAAFQNSNFFYFFGLVRENGKTNVCVTRRAGAGDPEQGAVQACVPAPEGPLVLKIEARGGAYDFLIGTRSDGGEAEMEETAPHHWTWVRRQWTAVLKDADGTILSTKKAGGFVGTVIGMYAYAPER